MRTLSLSLCLIVFLLLTDLPAIFAQEPTPASESGEQSTIPDNREYHLYLPGIALDRTVFYVDGNQGNDNNSGTQEFPWQSVEHAIDSIKPGDTVIIADGIYYLKPRPADANYGTRFAPAGLSADRPTVFKAAAGARVILTGPDQTPPTLYMSDNVRIEGFWIGGWRTEDEADKVFFGGSPIGRNRQFVNNTFFGYTELLQGSAEYILFQGNRFIHIGKGQFRHPLYLSGGYKEGSMSNHAIVDRNIFIGDEGWAIHGWHNARSNIITRNFVAGQYYALVMDGSDHLVANNFFWRQNGEPGKSPFAVWLPGANIITINNIFAHTPTGIAAVGANAMVRDNVFLAAQPVGENSVILEPGQEQAQIGASVTQIDTAIANLRAAFAQPIESIYEDETIEPAFAVLQSVVPSTSQLHACGRSWFDPDQMVNLGPDAPVPADVDAFWQSFRALGLRDFDRFGNVSGE